MHREDTPKDDRTTALSSANLVLPSSTRAFGMPQGTPIVVVLGMHRSGTSLLGNVLHFLGVDMADETDTASAKNAGGFWERPAIVALHDEIFALLERDVGRPSHNLPLPAGWWRRKDVQAVKARIVDFVRDQLASTGTMWGFKDPRTARLLPLWWEIFQQLDLRPRYILALRTPSEAASSMVDKSPKKRPMDIGQGELMWLSYNYDIIRHIGADSSLIIDYDDWFDHPVDAARNILEFLELDPGMTPDELEECVGSIVNAEFRHKQAVAGASGRADLALQLYRTLLRLRQDGSVTRSLKDQMAFLKILFRAVTPLVESLDALPELQRQVARIPALEQELAAADGQATRMGELEQRLDAASRDNATLRAELDASQAAMSATEAAAEAAARSAHDEGTALREQLALTIGKVHSARSEVSTLAERHERLKDDHAKSGAALAERDKDLSSARSDTERARSENLRLAQRIRELDTEMESTTRELEEIVGAHAQAHAGHLAELQGVRDESVRLARELEVRDQHVERATEAAREAGSLAQSLHAEVQALKAEIAQRPKDAERALSDPTSTRQERRALDPVGDNKTSPATAEIWRVDATGISGWAYFEAQPNVQLVVEVWSGDAMVATTRCGKRLIGTDLPGTRAAGAGFAIYWDMLPAEVRDKPLTLRLAANGEAISGAPIIRPNGHAPLSIERALNVGAKPAPEFASDEAARADYRKWLDQFGEGRDGNIAHALAYGRGLRDVDLVSIIVIGDVSDEQGLDRTLQSIGWQTFGRWEVLIASGGVAISIRGCKTISSTDWATVLTSAGGQKIVVIEAGDVLAPTALVHLLSVDSPGTALVYGDEDHIDASGRRGDPYFKGAWSLDLALAQDYACRSALIDLAAVREHARGALTIAALQGAVAEMIADLGSARARHCPFLLSSRSLANVVPPVVDPAPRLKWPVPSPPPLVSLIVPTRDRVDLLRQCVDGLLSGTDYPDIEVIIADNDSVERETLAYFDEVVRDDRVSVLRYSGEFDFAAINNFAAAAARGSIIGLINNDIKVSGPGWLREMTSLLCRDDVGIVGAKLLYGDDTIQHAGVVTGIGIASHIYKGKPRDWPGHGGRLRFAQDLSAVTAACMLVKASIWRELEGLSLDFPVAYNDVDFCLRARQAGYRVVWSPWAELYHLESQSRGSDADGSKRRRLDRDQALMTERWGHLLDKDPFYSPNLSLKATDARLAFPSRAVAAWDRQASAIE